MVEVVDKSEIDEDERFDSQDAFGRPQDLGVGALPYPSFESLFGRTPTRVTFLLMQVRCSEIATSRIEAVLARCPVSRPLNTIVLRDGDRSCHTGR